MTHNERVLELLSDGKPHTHLEVYRLGVVAHSRISDLRKKGYGIRQWRDGENYLYQLDGPLTRPDVDDNHGDLPCGPHQPRSCEAVGPTSGYVSGVVPPDRDYTASSLTLSPSLASEQDPAQLFMEVA